MKLIGPFCSCKTRLFLKPAQMSVYIPDDVQKVINLHQNTIQRRYEFKTVFQQLASFCQNLAEAYRKSDTVPKIEISNYHPHYLGASTEKIMGANLKPADFEWTIAREYGFISWKEAQTKAAIPIDEAFEDAVDRLLAGDLKTLQQILESEPGLLHRKSSYGHQAALIHYLGSNGVEIWRQVVPLNIVEMAKLLLEKGANKHLKARIYGGTDVKALIDSSTHPWDVGIGRELSSVFE